MNDTNPLELTLLEPCNFHSSSQESNIQSLPSGTNFEQQQQQQQHFSLAELPTFSLQSSIALHQPSQTTHHSSFMGDDEYPYVSPLQADLCQARSSSSLSQHKDIQFLDPPLPSFLDRPTPFAGQKVDSFPTSPVHFDISLPMTPTPFDSPQISRDPCNNGSLCYSNQMPRFDNSDPKDGHFLIPSRRDFHHHDHYGLINTPNIGNDDTPSFPPSLTTSGFQISPTLHPIRFQVNNSIDEFSLTAQSSNPLHRQDYSNYNFNPLDTPPSTHTTFGEINPMSGLFE
jgi:hypothetical protein